MAEKVEFTKEERANWTVIGGDVDIPWDSLLEYVPFVSVLEAFTKLSQYILDAGGYIRYAQLIKLDMKPCLRVRVSGLVRATEGEKVNYLETWKQFEEKWGKDE